MIRIGGDTFNGRLEGKIKVGSGFENVLRFGGNRAKDEDPGGDTFRTGGSFDLR